MMSGEKGSTRVFSVPKVYTKTKRVWLVLEIITVSVVLVGTALTLFWPAGFSPQKTLKNLQSLVSLRRQSSAVQKLSFEDQARLSIDGKIINISSLEKSADGSLVIKDSAGLAVILSPSKNLETQVRALQTVLSKAKIENREVSLVDFRFEKLVVRYK